MNRLITLSLLLVLLMVVSNRFAWFVPEVAVAASCEQRGAFESGDKQVHLLELYTSEGCSSCPPAEKWLNSLYKSPDLYKMFVPVAFHVDYWNYLGHKDPLSKKSFSRRQRQYASEWSSQTVYTPGFVKDGKEWRALVRKTPQKLGEKVGNLKVTPKKDGSFEVEFPQKKAGSVYGAHLLHGIENKIRRGENRGKVLKHNFVVSSLSQASIENGKATIKFKKAEVPFKDHSVAFWVTEKGSLRPLQATASCLEKGHF